MKTKLLTIITSVLLIGAIPAVAHHSFFAEFNPDIEVDFEGTVIEMEWVNPHSWLRVNVENENGEIEEWRFEGGSPNVLARLGWTRDSLPPGTKINISGYGAKDGSHRASTRTIELPDGSVKDLGSSSRR